MIPQAPVNDEARKANQNLPGMGGIYNQVNFHVYHYAGNNPVKYVDPDGRQTTENENSVPMFDNPWDAFKQFWNGNNKARDELIGSTVDTFTSLDGLQEGLDKAGYILDAADLINALIYYAQGEKSEAAISALATLGLIGGSLKNVTKNAAIGELTNLIKSGDVKGKNIINQIDDNTRIIFRKDVGVYAHPISSKGYNKPTDHYNIEIQTIRPNGNWKPKSSYHIIIDESGNIIDMFN